MGGKITRVVSGLYIGSIENAKDEENLIAHCITHILSVKSDSPNFPKSSGYNYRGVIIPENDEHCLLRVLSGTNDFIHSARVSNGNVLVLSESGTSANVSVVAAYLMSMYAMDSHKSVSALQGLVHAAQPIPSLQRQLDHFGMDRDSPEVGEDTDCPPTLLLSARSEHSRLLQKFDLWPNLDEDLACLEVALLSHDDLRASGLLLSPRAEESTADRFSASGLPRTGLYPAVRPALRQEYGFFLDDLEGDLDRPLSPPPSAGYSDEEDTSDPDGSDLEADAVGGCNLEEEVAGSIPIARRCLPSPLRSSTYFPGGNLAMAAPRDTSGTPQLPSTAYSRAKLSSTVPMDRFYAPL